MAIASLRSAPSNRLWRPELASFYSADNVGSGHIVLGRHQKDDGTHRSNGAHKTIDHGRHDRRPEERNDHATQGCSGVSAEGERRFIEVPVDLREGGNAGAHANRHVAENKAHDKNCARAGKFDRVAC